MTTRKALAYLGMLISVLVLITLYTDRARHAPVDGSESGEVAQEIPTAEFPVDYALGEFDERFGITKEKFLEIAEQAKRVWEDAAGRRLFSLHGEGTLKINLIFDWRQERLLGAMKAKATLDGTGRSFDQLQSDYNERSRMLDQYRRSFEESAGSYRVHLDGYNARVARWNESKDHSDSEYNALQSARREIESEQSNLEKKRADLNSRGEEFNKLGEKLTELAGKHNVDVENFNGTYAQSRDFEKGLFDGKSINIYEFEKEDDLKLALVHEFGHAIGLGHVDNPKAIMYRKLAVQDMNPIHLASEDLTLLLAKVK
ncbi:MAG: matrixin family metalloprotease [Ignavibacteriales bacterium]|nr:matrixin family metalloprotease [Ignavibacteriales bacterium]